MAQQKGLALQSFPLTHTIKLILTKIRFDIHYHDLPYETIRLGGAVVLQNLLRDCDGPPNSE